MVVRNLQLIIPAKLWDILNDYEHRTGVKKEDILMKAVIDIIEGVKCPRCGYSVKVFENVGE